LAYPLAEEIDYAQALGDLWAAVAEIEALVQCGH
jgi:hypothetical protein